jgi:hypothetical protein
VGKRPPRRGSLAKVIRERRKCEKTEIIIRTFTKEETRIR